MWKLIQIFSTIKCKHKRVKSAALKIASTSIDDTSALVSLQLEYRVLPKFNLSAYGMGKTRGRELYGANSCPGCAPTAAKPERSPARPLALRPQTLVPPGAASSCLHITAAALGGKDGDAAGALRPRLKGRPISF